MKKILLYAAVPFFLHYALLNTRDCIRKIRDQNGPILYREHTPTMKNFVGSQTGAVEGTSASRRLNLRDALLKLLENNGQI